MALQVAFLLVQQPLLLLKYILQLLDFLLLLVDFRLLFRQLLFLILALEGVLLEDDSFLCYVIYHLLLLLLVLLPLGVQLSCPCYDLLFLRREVLIRCPLLSLLLQQPDSLQRPLTYWINNNDLE